MAVEQRTNFQTKPLVVGCLYDRPEKMNQTQLELAWLGCIFEAPAKCRKSGLGGVDLAMFQTKKVFEIGLMILRNENAEPFWPGDEVLSKLMPGGWVTKLVRAEREGLYLPQLYKVYCNELERRFEIKLEDTPTWML